MAKSVEQIITSIATAEERLANLRAALVAAQAKEVTLNPGDVVRFEFGRAETKVVLTGTVVGEQKAENGVALVRVCVGTGFEADFKTIRKTQILVDDADDEVANAATEGAAGAEVPAAE